MPPDLKNPLSHVGRQVGIPGARVNPNGIIKKWRVEWREEPLLAAVMAGCPPRPAAAVMCVFPLAGVFWACVASRRAAVQFCFVFMCVGACVGVYPFWRTRKF